MIKKDRHGEFIATCEDCGADAYGGTQEDFKAFWESLKAAGWRARKDGDEWQHQCPTCAEGT